MMHVVKTCEHFYESLACFDLELPFYVRFVEFIANTLAERLPLLLAQIDLGT
jgi:hypothetical protein